MNDKKMMLKVIERCVEDAEYYKQKAEEERLKQEDALLGLEEQ